MKERGCKERGCAAFMKAGKAAPEHKKAALGIGRKFAEIREICENRREETDKSGKMSDDFG